MVTQIAAAEIVQSDAQPKQAAPPNISGEIVRTDGQPRSTGAVNVSGEIVRTDGQPRTTGAPNVSGEIVRTDGQPRTTGAPRVSGEIVRTDGQPKKPQTPAISPFVGEIAVGVGLLITYGPQILALAATVASLAAAVSVVVNTSKSSLMLVKSIGQKLQRMLQVLMGPLSVSSGMAKDGVENVSANLLQVAQFVSKNLNAPVSEVNGQVNHALAMSRDLESLAKRGQTIAGDMKSLSDTSLAELNGIVAGGEVQLFRDGAKKVANTLGARADQAGAAFNQTLQNSTRTTNQLEGISADIATALGLSGADPRDVTLQDIGLSGAKMGKELIGARRFALDTNRTLAASSASVGGLHTDIMSLLTDMKTELELFAHENGVTRDHLNRMMADPKVKAAITPPAASVARPGTPGISAEQGSDRDLTQQIGFMVDELDRMNRSNAERLLDTEADRAAARASMGRAPLTQTEQTYQQMVSAYKKYLTLATGDPGNQNAIAAAKASYETLEAAYKAAIQK